MQRRKEKVQLNEGTYIDLRLLSLLHMFDPVMQEPVALMSDGAKSSIIENPPCFSSSFVQVDRGDRQKSIPVTRWFSFNVLEKHNHFFYACGILERTVHLIA
jgi:hypothetical protein